MGTGVSLILIAVGAVLAWAVNVTTSGFNINTIGYILLVVGIVGFVLSLIFWSSWAGPGYLSRRRTVTDTGSTGSRRTIVEDETA
jgi:beta-lactamase regulating signal transducer with metallopeptidase domain